MRFSVRMRDSFVFLLSFAGFVFLLEAADLWPGGHVPLKFSPSFTKVEKSLIREALKEIEENTCIRFHNKDPDDAHFVVFAKPFDSKVCRSHIGRQGTKQTVFLGADCLHRRTILHQVMHTLGFDHEHCRPDRDDYVIIKWDNIQHHWKREFEKCGQDALDTIKLATGYAYNSITHFKAYEGATNKSIATIVPKRSVQLGGGNGLSEIDIERINLLYKCPGRTTVA